MILLFVNVPFSLDRGNIDGLGYTQDEIVSTVRFRGFIIASVFNNGSEALSPAQLCVQIDLHEYNDKVPFIGSCYLPKF